ncbi:MAG: glycosyltransferase [Candidatus Caldarchaeum sp.]|nr:glycosyltransferase [Candidatus Caldarchaeum sp.]
MNEAYALYITSFPPQRYRRPLLASKALKLLGLKTLFYEGWDLVNRYAPLRTVAKFSQKLPKPLDWLSKDMAYETGLYFNTKNLKPKCIINLNTVGAYSSRNSTQRKPLIIDLQDLTIEDDETIPIYDRQMLKLADMVIFASKAINDLVEKKHHKLLKKSAHIPFGIDLEAFDSAYKLANAQEFKIQEDLRDKKIISYSGGAYLWGTREGQGLDILLQACAKVVKEVPEVRIVVQGTAAPETQLWWWLMNKMKQQKLEGKILLLPPTNPFDKNRLSMVKASDVLLLPIGDILGTYYAEQQKLYEYMAAQRPIAMIATPARLNVVDHNSAYIAERRDPDEFAYQITKALDEPEEAAAKAARARKIVEQRYDWKVLIPRYAEAVASVLVD